MPRIVIKFGKSKVQQMILELGREYTFGRDKGCDVVLPNVSVSREHARLIVDETGARVVDLGSQNGLYFQETRVSEHILASQDEVMIGRYSFVFLGDNPEDRFFQGRAVAYLPHYESSTTSRAAQTGTFAIDASELKRIRHLQHVVEKARVILEADASKAWIPGDKLLSFGSSGMVNVPGMGSFGGVVAEITWSGSQHSLESKARFTATQVNGKKLSEPRALRNGDRIRIGQVRFVYEAPLPS